MAGSAAEWAAQQCAWRRCALRCAGRAWEGAGKLLSRQRGDSALAAGLGTLQVLLGKTSAARRVMDSALTTACAALTEALGAPGAGAGSEEGQGGGRERGQLPASFLVLPCLALQYVDAELAMAASGATAPAAAQARALHILQWLLEEVCGASDRLLMASSTFSAAAAAAAVPQTAPGQQSTGAPAVVKPYQPFATAQSAAAAAGTQAGQVGATAVTAARAGFATAVTAWVAEALHSAPGGPADPEPAPGSPALAAAAAAAVVAADALYEVLCERLGVDGGVGLGVGLQAGLAAWKNVAGAVPPHVRAGSAAHEWLHVRMCRLLVEAQQQQQRQRQGGSEGTAGGSAAAAGGAALGAAAGQLPDRRYSPPPGAIRRYVRQGLRLYPQNPELLSLLEATEKLGHANVRLRQSLTSALEVAPSVQLLAAALRAEAGRIALMAGGGRGAGAGTGAGGGGWGGSSAALALGVTSLERLCEKALAAADGQLAASPLAWCMYLR